MRDFYILFENLHIMSNLGHKTTPPQHALSFLYDFFKNKIVIIVLSLTNIVVSEASGIQARSLHVTGEDNTACRHEL